MIVVKDDKYKLIVNAAIGILIKKGYACTSVADIVKTANIAKGTFYLYFESKSALIPAIAEFLMEEIMYSIKGVLNDKNDATLKETIVVMIDETFKITSKYRKVIVLCYSFLAFDHSFEKWERIYAPYYEWFQTILEKEQSRSTLAVPIDLKQSSIMIINLIEQAAERYYFADEHDTSLELRKKEVAQFIFRALGYINHA